MTVTKVTTDGIADSAVNSAKIGVDVIAAEDLAANSVTVSEISDGAVTAAKLHSAALSPLTLDATNNRVGINAASPQAKLEIREDVAGETGAFIVNPNASGYAAVRIGNSDRATNGDHLIYGASNLGLRSKTGANITVEPGNNIQMTVTTEGYVSMPNQPNCMLYKSSNQAIPQTTPTPVTGWAVSNGVNSMFDSTNSRITAPVAGTYIVGGTCQFSQAGGVHIHILKNNSPVGNDGYLDFGANDAAGAAAYSLLFTMAANDFISMTVYNTVASNLTSNRTKLWMVKVA